MRKFHIQKINEWNKKQNEEMEKQEGKASTSSEPVRGPNITPSSVYNYKG